MANSINIGGTLIDGTESTRLQDFQYNGVSYLYNLEPQQLNYFMVDKFYDPYVHSKSGAGSDGSTGGEYGKTDPNIPDGVQYRISKISGFTLPRLEVNSDLASSPLRVSIPKPAREGNNLTLTWTEDVYQTVRRYHMNWMKHWYDKYLDCMVCGVEGKYRNLTVILYHYVNNNKNDGAPVMTPKPVAAITYLGLIPKEIPELSFDYGSPENEGKVDIKYSINGIELYFYPYEKNDKEYIGGLAKEIQDGFTVTDLKNTGLDKDKVWGSQNSSSMYYGVTDANHQSVYYL